MCKEYDTVEKKIINSTNLDTNYGVIPEKESDRPVSSMKVNEVIIKDIHMSFMSMVVFMVKWALAAIPDRKSKFSVWRFCLFGLGMFIILRLLGC